METEELDDISVRTEQYQDNIRERVTTTAS